MVCCKLLFVIKERLDLSSSTLALNIRIYLGRYTLTHLKKAAAAFITKYSQAYRKIESVDFPSLPTKTTYFPSKMKMPGSQIDLVIYSLQQKNQILVKIQIEVDYSAT